MIVCQETISESYLKTLESLSARNFMRLPFVVRDCKKLWAA